MSRVECCNLIARAHRSVGGESEGKGRYRERPASDRGSSSDDASRASGDASWAVLWLPDARFVVDVRLPWPSRCPDCGGSVVSEGEVEPVARRLPFEGPRRQRRSRGAPLGGSAAASGRGTSMVRVRP